MTAQWLKKPCNLADAGAVSYTHLDVYKRQVDAERGHEDEISCVRRIFVSCWERSEEELIYTVKGSGFLHHMVRNLVGTFVLVGKKTLKPEDISQILQARNRAAAGATAPASGLYLVSVDY